MTMNNRYYCSFKEQSYFFDLAIHHIWGKLVTKIVYIFGFGWQSILLLLADSGPSVFQISVGMESNSNDGFCHLCEKFPRQQIHAAELFRTSINQSASKKQSIIGFGCKWLSLLLQNSHSSTSLTSIRIEAVNYTAGIFIIDHLPKDYQELHLVVCLQMRIDRSPVHEWNLGTICRSAHSLRSWWMKITESNPTRRTVHRKMFDR